MCFHTDWGKKEFRWEMWKMSYQAGISVFLCTWRYILFGDIISKPKPIRILFFGFPMTHNESQFESIYCYSLV